MSRDTLLRNCMPDTVCLNPIGENADEISPEQFETSLMSRDFFEKYYSKMLEYSKYCENQRFLVNNNTFFANMIVSEKSVGFLCMAYFKGLDTLRWHASIDDEESCESIMRSISELESRMDCL